MSKTIKSVLEEVSRKSRLDAFAPGYTKLKPRKEDYVDQALSDIESIIKEQVIGMGELHVSHVCPPDNIDCAKFNARGGLRHEQNKALLKALGRGEK